MNNYPLVIRPHNRITANISGLSKLWSNVRSEILPHNSQDGLSYLRRIILDDVLSLDSGQCQSWFKISLVPQQTLERLHQWANGQQFTEKWGQVSGVCWWHQQFTFLYTELPGMLLLNPCLSRAWMAQSLQQVSVSCVKPPPKLMSQAQTMHWSHLSTRAVGHAQEDTSRFLQGWLGRQLSSWTFSKASTHMSLKGEL